MTSAEINLASTPRSSDLVEELRSFVSEETVLRPDESMARRTTLRVGGPADLWVEPANEQDLAAIIRFAQNRSLPVLMMGRGSNLLVRDGGVRGVVVSLNHLDFSAVTVEGERVHCGAGARLKAVALEARQHGLEGLEFLEGIPGSIGGALRMNAGAHGGALLNIVVEVRLLDSNGRLETIPGSELNAEYRSCAALKTRVAVEAVLQGKAGDAAEIQERMKQFNEHRWSSQPAAPSAGCIFKNPDSISAGQLVEELGMKGARVGGATVSHKHGNFIVTDPSASAGDVLELIDQITKRALAKRGVALETEVQIIGEEGGAT